MQTKNVVSKEAKRGRIIVGLVVASTLVAVGGVGVHHFAVAQGSQDSSELGHAKALSSAFRNVAETSLPAVVTVKSTTKARKVSSTDRGGNPFEGTPWEDLFGDRFKDGFPGQNGFTPPRGGMGSGVIIDPAGVILTNNHVVEGADKVTIELSDGTVLDATEIHTDPRTDLAVVRVKPEGSLPAAKLGDSEDLEVGDWVLAIGNPFELSLTVSAGIISGKGRSLGLVERGTFLQTDAAINPGNSGGPLINLDGEVIGINTAIASRSGGYQGIGFAIPINTAKRIAKQLVSDGEVRRAYLGVAISPIAADVAEKLNLEPRSGVLIAKVHPNTPAAESDLQATDVITKFAGKPVSTPGELQRIVEGCDVDSTQTVTIMRDGEEREVEVVVRALPTEFGLNATQETLDAPETPEEGFAESLGMRVSELTTDVANKLGYDNTNGVLVSEVKPDGVAFEHGVRDGMVILKVGQQRVNSVEEFNAALEEETLEDGILVLIQTPDGNRFEVLKN